jgi:hypothetical protein
VAQLIAVKHGKAGGDGSAVSMRWEGALRYTGSAR